MMQIHITINLALNTYSMEFIFIELYKLYLLASKHCELFVKVYLLSSLEMKQRQFYSFFVNSFGCIKYFGINDIKCSNLYF